MRSGSQLLRRKVVVDVAISAGVAVRGSSYSIPIHPVPELDRTGPTESAVSMDAIFESLGFEVDHVAGISRAWLLTLPGREFVVVTDPGGYDLPNAAGPFAAFHYTGAWTPADEPALLDDVSQLATWLIGVLPGRSPQIALLRRIHSVPSQDTK